MDAMDGDSTVGEYAFERAIGGERSPTSPEGGESPRSRVPPSALGGLWPKPEYRSFGAKVRAALRNPRQLVRHLSSSHFRGPVKWLLGRDLLTHMRRIALYASYADELDHRDWMNAAPIRLDTNELCDAGAFWFDYLADTGDSQLAMYNLAYFVLGDLWLKGNALGFRGIEGAERLVRGRLLVLGGDTAYHVADHGTLEERFRAPFNWAYNERISEGMSRSAKHYVAANPGNHDYYDSLTGFNRLFRTPCVPAATDKNQASVYETSIADYLTIQNASYFALDMPFGWRLWGIDSQAGKLDFRQRQFFLTEQAKQAATERLIVITPEPSTVFETVHNDALAPFEELALPRPFVGPARMPADECIHLDLAGDIHHYARYSKASHSNYASVVAGGGAFLHPSHARLARRDESSGADHEWPAPAEQSYPVSADSRRDTTSRLLCPWYILRGGYVWLIGAAAFVALYFGLTVAPSTLWVGKWLTAEVAGAAEQPHELDSDTIGLLARNVIATPDLPEELSSTASSRRSGVAPPPSDLRSANEVSAGVYDEPSNREYLAAALLIALLVFSGLYSQSIFKRARARRRSRGTSSAPSTASGRKSEVTPIDYAPMALLTLAVAVFIGALLIQFGDRLPQERLHPFASSVLFMIFFAPLPLSAVWNFQYLETLPKQAKRRRLTKGDFALRWYVLGFGVLSAYLAIMAYGACSLATMASNASSILALFFLAGGPIGLSIVASLKLKLADKVAVRIAGVWFAVLLITVPLLLVLYASPAQIMGACLAVLGVAGVTAVLHHRWVSQWLLVGGWIAAGVAALAPLAFGIHAYDVTLSRFAGMFALGAFFTCAWFGWYLAVASAFSGHANEAGGAARVDKYRHFIRFKLEPDKLTGYVIGLKRASTQPGKLAAHDMPELELVDTIGLTCRQLR